MSTGITAPGITAPPARPALKQGGRFAKFKPFLAPLLITCILLIGDLTYRILPSYRFTALAIVSSILLEFALNRFATGRWLHWTQVPSSYITGISVGILVQANTWWPFVLCSLLSISSKYALRIKDRHLWNPSNLGVSVLLIVIPDVVVPLSLQWGNELWPSLIILCLGSLILFTLGRLHITATYAVAFVVLALIRSAVTGRVWISEVALLTHPAYQLFLFFMITDPKTTTRTRLRQCAVAVLIAIVETILRLCEVIHAPYYALFITAPITNLAEILWDVRHSPRPSERPESIAGPYLAQQQRR